MHMVYPVSCERFLTLTLSSRLTAKQNAICTLRLIAVYAVAVGRIGRDAMGSNLQQHASQLHAQHASDSISMSNINVLSLLDPSNHSSLLSKQSHDGAQGHLGQYDAPDAFLTHRDLVSRGNGVGNGLDHSSGWNSIAKSEPVSESRMDSHTPDNHHGATENGAEKNMQDLLESVQRRNPVDTHGWKVGLQE
jgi:hypothetical protein